MIKITERQRKELKNILQEDEYQELIESDAFEFFTELHLLLVGYMDEDYNHTHESYKLQQLYDEIYELNELV